MSLNQGDIYNEPGAIVSDNVDIGLDSIISGNVNTNIPGTYTIKYNAIDNAGNRAVEKTRTVRVKDITPPEIELIGAETITIRQNTVFNDPGYRVSDNFDKAGLQVIKSTNLDIAKVGNYYIDYKSTDSSGNLKIVRRNIIVERMTFVDYEVSLGGIKLEKANDTFETTIPKNYAGIRQLIVKVIDHNIIPQDGLIFFLRTGTIVTSSGKTNLTQISGQMLSIDNTQFLLSFTEFENSVFFEIDVTFNNFKTRVNIRIKEGE
jgi:hypothetical protein